MATNVGRIIEYGQIPEDSHSRVTVLRRVTKGRTEYRLVHSTPGYECAGSMARWTDERYAVNFDMDGSIHGRSFLDEQAARDLFDKWTKQD